MLWFLLRLSLAVLAARLVCTALRPVWRIIERAAAFCRRHFRRNRQNRKG
ncbi:MAG: hypothetical protein LUC17_02305 [Oscillospiraceae bacterium]|nr:hypothetical protein [Oscillospiraceae bacterium]